ncbi:hypothetical protein [Proteiniclasticum sp.]|nr:hypothetical protein [Proteiniclasticum sp.]
MGKTENTKLLLAIPSELKEQLQAEGDKVHRSLNNYILWLLVHRNDSENK